MRNWMRFFPSLLTAHRSLGALMSPRSTPESSPRHSSTDSRATQLGRVATGFFLVVGLVAPMLAPSASAQASLPSSPDAKEATSAHWSPHFDRQIAQALRQQPSMRAAHIQIVIEAAAGPDHPDLSRTVGALLHVIERDSNRDHRLMAVQALHQIGPEHVGAQRYRQAMSQLYTLAQSELPEAVRLAAERTLSRYAKAG
jgi:hypothetical protein